MIIIAEQITRFRGQYWFLSNFYPYSGLKFHGIWYKNSEAAFQAQKTLNLRIQESYKNLSPLEAKRLGKQIKMRSDWDIVKDAVMLQVVSAKFYWNPTLVWKLIETGDAELIEGNTWGDTYWGICNGVGQNRLGYILMLIRSSYMEESVSYDAQLLKSLAYYNNGGYHHDE